MFSDEHIEVLKKLRKTYDRGLEGAASRTGADWYNSLKLPSYIRPPEGIERQKSNPKRDDIFSLVSDTSVDTLSLCAAIFAWGGMRADHGKKLFIEQNRWHGTVDAVRSNKLSRRDSYCLLHKLRLDKSLPGMGPAYFTKLIFFLRGRNVEDIGYIMDQWTGCSVNVLTSDPRKVLMNVTCTWRSAEEVQSDFTVSDLNDADRYEQFCCAIDQLSSELKLGKVDTELLLMSEGRGKGIWRKHVIANRIAVTVTNRRVDNHVRYI